MFNTRLSYPFYILHCQSCVNLYKLASFPYNFLIHKFMAGGERKDKRKRGFYLEVKYETLIEWVQRACRRQDSKFTILGFLFSQPVDHKKCLSRSSVSTVQRTKENLRNNLGNYWIIIVFTLLAQSSIAFREENSQWCNRELYWYFFQLCLSYRFTFSFTSGCCFFTFDFEFEKHLLKTICLFCKTESLNWYFEEKILKAIPTISDRSFYECSELKWTT